MSKTRHNKDFPKERNQTNRYIITEKIGTNSAGSPMRDRREKRSKEKKNYKNEDDYYDDED